MTGEHITVLAALVLVAFVGTTVAARWQSNRIEARFLAAIKPAEPELPSWSESVGFDPAERLAAHRREAADELWRERMVADLTGPDPLPFLAELVNRNVLAIEPARELTGATT